MSRRTVIAVIGAGDADEQVRGQARAAGRAIAAAGCHLICGGRGGVMAAACCGHHEGRRDGGGSGQLTIGVLPGYDHGEANEWVDVAMPTGLGLARNVCVVASSDAVLAISGGSGTLSEIAIAWQLGRPLAALGETGGWAQALAGRALDDKRAGQIRRATSADKAISYLLEALSIET